MKTAIIILLYSLLTAPFTHTGLPVVYIDTEGGAAVESKELRVAAELRIHDPNGNESLEPLACTIKGRGNITWRWPKKPYRLRFSDDVPLLGMPAHRDWVLLANFCDRTLLRNLLAMRVSSLTSLDWTPRCVPVELVLNGRHLGQYLLSESVSVGPDRLSLSSGGYLLESDFHYDNEVQWEDYHGSSAYLFCGIPFAVKYPSAKDLTPEREAFIKKYVKDAAAALYGKDFADPQKGYAAYLDVDSFVDYWLVFAIMGNSELGHPGSVYTHLDEGGKLKAGPCWDFDWCLNKSGTSRLRAAASLNKGAFWYGRLFKDPAFCARVKKRFEELLPELLRIPKEIDGYKAKHAASAQLNFALWNPAMDRWENKGLLINGDETLSFDDAVTQLRDTYMLRLELLSLDMEKMY
ncbi:MAG: CotH kinase family protein [Bacteroidales bacterium]|nr:CotH kinase family protein [Bacteroidales bacterium]